MNITHLLTWGRGGKIPLLRTDTAKMYTHAHQERGKQWFTESLLVIAKTEHKLNVQKLWTETLRYFITVEYYIKKRMNG